MVMGTDLSEKEFLDKYLPRGFILENRLYTELTRPDVIKGAMNFRFRPSDIVVSSYPKSGTTWTSEIVCWLVNANNPDICMTADLVDRVPYIEIINHKTGVPYYEELNQVPETKQRIIKTHLPPPMLHASIWETKPKIVHAYRNPLDAAVSFYHFYKNFEAFGPFKGTWDEFFEMFKNGWLVYGDLFDHMHEWWKHKNDSNVLLVEYEAMLQVLNAKNEIRRIAEFLALGNAITDELVEQVAQKCSFGSMKSNPLIYTPFIRKGVIGDWKNYFTEEQKKYVLDTFNKKVVPLGVHVRYDEFEK